MFKVICKLLSFSQQLIPKTLYSIKGAASHQMSIRGRRRRADDEGSIWDFLLGLGLGAIGYAIVSAFTKPNCPVCNNKIEKGIRKCPHCQAELEWN
jgi:hypothetical protein